MTVGRLHVITDTVVQDRFSHTAIARSACDGGADTIQFREKRSNALKLVATAREILKICGDVPLIINDRADVACVVAAGVHLGADDLPVAQARAIGGPDMLIGGSASDLESARRVAAAGADYIGFGHIFPTASKDKTTAAVGPDQLARVCSAVDVPVIAIGGINQDNIASVLEAGAWGVAVIGAVCCADDPAAATRKLRDIIDRYQARTT